MIESRIGTWTISLLKEREREKERLSVVEVWMVGARTAHGRMELWVEKSLGFGSVAHWMSCVHPPFVDAPERTSSCLPGRTAIEWTELVAL